jgi:hypothetical protein
MSELAYGDYINTRMRCLLKLKEWIMGLNTRRQNENVNEEYD